MEPLTENKSTRRTFRHFLPRFLRTSPATETTVLAVAVGIMGGFGAMGFKKLIFLFQELCWGGHEMPLETLYQAPWYVKLLLPAAGGLIVGPLIHFFAREARGHGVPEVMAAVATKNSVIRPAVVLVKALASAVSIATGGSVGREGPIVQIGAALASSFGQFIRVNAAQLKILVGCGVAAGISATFNAPIAGTIFALELIVSDFGLTSFTPIIVSAVSATAIVHHFHGNITEFILPAFHMVSVFEFGFYLCLGLAAGVIGPLFSRSLYTAEDVFDKVPVPRWLKPAIGGLIVGAIAIQLPHVLGVGYQTVTQAFTGNVTFSMLALLLVVKLLATAITIGSGGSGGVFAPSLFLGATLGGMAGIAAHKILSGGAAPVGAYVLVGMAAVNSACTLAPLSAMIIMMELTDQYSMILPLMLAVVTASFISRKLSADSVYTLKLSRRGVKIHQGEDLNILRTIKVKDILRKDASVFMEGKPFRSLLDMALRIHRNVIFIAGENGIYRGAVTLLGLKEIISSPAEWDKDHDLDDFVEDLEPVPLRATLDTVVNRFAESGLNRLPVTEKTGNLAGSIVLGDLIRNYNIEVANRNIIGELGAQLQAHDTAPSLELADGMLVTTVSAPEWITGRTLPELALRKRFGVSVVMVQRSDASGAPVNVQPTLEYAFRPADTLLVTGTRQAVDAFASAAG